MTISLEEHVARAIAIDAFPDKPWWQMSEMLQEDYRGHARAAIAAVREYGASPMHFAELCQDNADLRSSAASIRESERAACETIARILPGWMQPRDVADAIAARKGKG